MPKFWLIHSVFCSVLDCLHVCVLTEELKNEVLLTKKKKKVLHTVIFTKIWEKKKF